MAVFGQIYLLKCALVARVKQSQAPKGDTSALPHIVLPTSLQALHGLLFCTGTRAHLIAQQMFLSALNRRRSWWV